jgi:hypothetical protein
MPIRLAPRPVRIFPLRKTESVLGGNGTTVSFRYASQGDVEKLEGFLATSTTTLYETSSPEIDQPYSEIDIAFEQLLLVMSACNLCDFDGSEMFQFSDGSLIDNDHNAEAWQRLHETIMLEIHDFCVLINPFWNIGAEN